LKQEKDKLLVQEDLEISSHNKKFLHLVDHTEITIGFSKDKIKILGNNQEKILEIKFNKMLMKGFNKLSDKLSFNDIILIRKIFSY
jgi:hypothetical protein